MACGGMVGIGSEVLAAGGPAARRIRGWIRPPTHADRRRHTDRVRFGAVCQQWRRTERAHEQPPPMPWLVAAGHCVGLHDAAIHRVALPEDAHTAACRGSFDNWLALVPVSPPPYQAFLLNPFIMERIHLPVWNVGDGGGRSARSSYHQRPTRRIAPSPLSFVPEFFSDPQLGSVAVCRLRQKESSCPWWCITDTLYLEDIAFFQGKLHAVDGAKHTYEFEDRELEQMRNVHLYCTTLRRFLPPRKGTTSLPAMRGC